MSPYRKPDHRNHGTQVTICGRRLRTSHDLICTLPLRHTYADMHATVAVANDGSFIAVIDNIHRDEVEMWQLGDPPE